jgi:hypothetical protein
MDWIEKLFGLDLDGGDGSAETMIMFAGMILAAGLIAARVPPLRERLQTLFGHKAR